MRRFLSNIFELAGLVVFAYAVFLIIGFAAALVFAGLALIGVSVALDHKDK